MRRVGKRTYLGLAASVGVAVVVASCLGDDGPLNRLVFVQQPTDAVAGSEITPAIVVEIRDPGGNVVGTATDQVTLSVAGGSGTLVGTVSRAAVDGVATFAGISIETVDTYTLTAAAVGLGYGRSEEFSITHAGAEQLTFTVQPSQTVENLTIAPAIVVEVQDAFGNVATDASDDVTLTLGGGSGTLVGIATRPAVAGVATFTDIAVDAPGSYTLDAAAAGLTPGTSAEFDVTETPVSTELVITVQPGNAAVGVAISPAITVEVWDQFGGVMTATSDSITLTLSGGIGTLGGTVTRPAVAGVATFNDITIDEPGTYRLTAAAPGLVSDTSVAFDVIDAPAEPVELTDANFDVLTSSGVVLVDFWATWCGPCLTQAPIIEDIAAQYTGRALVGKLDVDYNPVTTARFGIQWIPTLIILKDGQEVWRAVGVQTEGQLQAALDAVLAQ
jgi:thioredoxin